MYPAIPLKLHVGLSSIFNGLIVNKSFRLDVKNQIGAAKTSPPDSEENKVLIHPLYLV